MGSTLVRYEGTGVHLGAFNLAIAVALFDTVESFIGHRRELQLKWPNDLILQGAKLSGILSEIVDGYLVVGVGVNLVSAPDLSDRPTIALTDYIGTVINRDAFAQLLSDNFARNLLVLRKGHEDTVRSWWLERAHDIGMRVTVHDEDGLPLAGEFRGISPDGSMALRLDSGEMRAIHAGDVTLD